MTPEKARRILANYEIGPNTTPVEEALVTLIQAQHSTIQRIKERLALAEEQLALARLERKDLPAQTHTISPTDDNVCDRGCCVFRDGYWWSKRP